MASKRVVQSEVAWKVLAVVSASSSCFDHTCKQKGEQEGKCIGTTPGLNKFYESLFISSSAAKFFSLNTHQYTLCEKIVINQAQKPISNSELAISENDKEKTKQYDFVVIGHGNAGRCALETLRKRCPSASIAVIDPLRPCLNDSSNVEYYADAAVGFHPATRSVRLHNGSQNLMIQYKYSILVATGARGSPPPSYSIDPNVQDRVLELRSTVFGCGKDPGRPNLPPEKVRSLTLKAASAGTNIAIVGSGWEAVELAVASKNIGKSSSKTSLVFGGRGPLSHVLPQYLSAAVAKKLRQKKIQIDDRSVIRYIGGDNTKLDLYTAKSYDLLDSSKNTFDLLVVAPEVRGHMGSAVLPTKNVPSSMLSSSQGRPWYQTWTQLSNASFDIEHPLHVLSCYADDGRVVVNSELNAGTGIYAAGSAAKYPNFLTGHADVAGTGYVDGKQAGRVAASNMCTEYENEKSKNTFLGGGSKVLSFAGGRSEVHNPTQRSFQDPIPVWRSDVNSYVVDGQKNKMSRSSLERVGIRALCVGNCDSETCSTNALWWTNQAAQARLRSVMEKDASKSMIGARRRKTVSFTRPVYGFGVVYYLDYAGRVQGIMVWGLPYTMNNSNKLNKHLVEQIKKVIIDSNAICDGTGSEADYIRLNSYLEEESRKIVASAFQGRADDATSHQLDCLRIEDFPRPLRRFTDARPPSARNVRILKRNDGSGHGVMGEDLYSVCEDDYTARNFQALEPEAPSKSNGKVNQAEAMRKWRLWEENEKLWEQNEDRSRPPKEELLWLRKGDENKNISRKDKLKSAYLRYM